MRERFAGWRVEAAHHAPGRLLLLDAEDGGAGGGRFERQMQFGRSRMVNS